MKLSTYCLEPSQGDVSRAAFHGHRPTHSRHFATCRAMELGQPEAPLWDVVGLGQAMVDVVAAVEDDVVESLVGAGRRR